MFLWTCSQPVICNIGCVSCICACCAGEDFEALAPRQLPVGTTWYSPASTMMKCPTHAVAALLFLGMATRLVACAESGSGEAPASSEPRAKSRLYCLNMNNLSNRNLLLQNIVGSIATSSTVRSWCTDHKSSCPWTKTVVVLCFCLRRLRRVNSA